MMLTERDINILRFINDFGYARSSILKEMFFTAGTLSGQKQMCHRRLKKMIDGGLIKREREFRYGEMLYQLNRAGANKLKEHGIKVFWVQSSVGWGKFIHNDYVQQVYLKFRKEGLRDFVSERRMRKMPVFFDHIPDLLVGASPENFLVIEVELELKRIEVLRNKLLLNLEINQGRKILYLCGNKNILKRVTGMAQELDPSGKRFLSVKLDNFLDNPTQLINQLN